MIREAIYHKSDSTYAYAAGENSIVIKLRTKRSDIKKAVLCYGNRYDTNSNVEISQVEMSVSYQDSMFVYYETTITTPYKTICYYFKISDENETIILSQDRFTNNPPQHRNRYYMFSYICKGDLFEAGEWWEDAVIYQIFVDRFNKENKDESWHKIPGHGDIYGGNLRGIIDKIDYLSDLGVNCIYLTPIFESKSNHKYDTLDYFDIARDFGDKETFKELMNKCHKNGIKVVLDAVFNHSDSSFFAFKDFIDKGEKSQYRDWYCVDNNGSYEMFATVKQMPKLNTNNPDTAKYLLEAAAYWISEFDIDGWRLDVANEIDHKFWRRFREVVKNQKKDAIIIGEVWDGGESYLYGEQFDTVMNYPFMYMLLDYFAWGNIDTKEFDSQINNHFAKYKKYIRKLLINLLDSHDTSRFLHECGGDVEKLKMAAFFQMTCIGIPMIFYGDEAGISGANDPDCRRTIDFDNINKDLYDFFKKIINIRKNSSALKHGEYKTLYTDNNVYAYMRFDVNESVVNIINNSSSTEKLSLEIEGKKAYDVLNNREYTLNNGKLEIKVVPYGKYVLMIK